MTDDSWEYWDEMVPATWQVLSECEYHGIRCQPGVNGEVHRVPRWALIAREPASSHMMRAAWVARRADPQRLLEFLTMTELLKDEDPRELEALKKSFVYGPVACCKYCGATLDVYRETWFVLEQQSCYRCKKWERE